MLAQESRNTDLTDSIRQNKLQRAYTAAITATNDSLKSGYFSRISLAYLHLGDSLLFRKTNLQAMRLAQKIQDSVTHAETHWDLGEFFSNKEVLDSAYYHYAEAQKIYEIIDDHKLSANLLRNMGVIQTNTRDFIGAEINTIKAIRLLKPLNDNEQLYKCYNGLASITDELREYDQAIEYYKTALVYLQKGSNKENLRQDVLHNMGVTYINKGDYTQAIRNFTSVLKQENLYQTDIDLYALAQANLVLSRFKSGDTLGIRKQFNRVLHLRDSIGGLAETAAVYYNMAEYHIYTKDTLQALDYARKARIAAKKSKNNKRLLLTLGLLPRLDPMHASEYTQAYINLNDSLQIAERKIRNKFERISFETDEYIAENELLDRQRQLWTGIAAGILLLAIAIFVIVTQRIKNQKLRFQQEQQESNQEIFDLMLSQKEKIKEGKQEEQKRISEELHDGVLGQMNGIRMVLVGLNKKTDEDAIAKRSDVITKLQDVQEEVRTISHELNAASHEKMNNFIYSVQDLLQTICDGADMTYKFNYNDSIEWDNLGGYVKINLYRIIQENLQNCVKHAKASMVSLDFTVQEPILKISLADNGVGFNVKKGKRGIGLKNISSRVEKLEGTWHIKSEIGKGTTLIIDVPYNM